MVVVSKRSVSSSVFITILSAKRKLIPVINVLNQSPVLPEQDCKVDKKAMIRKRYNRISLAALNTKWERDTLN